MTRAMRGWIPAVLWAAAIFWVSSRPKVPVPDTLGADKLLHFGAYALLGFLLARGASGSGLAPRWPVALGWLYGVSDEVHQSFVPGRSADPADWLADALGVVAGTLLYVRFGSPRRGRVPGSTSDR
ncbi:MAG TPA: VanZ family protein [Longimicrobiaceae bacterium]|nr:VanZ family protein [Longimicrobiaceae bacterium]